MDPKNNDDPMIPKDDAAKSPSGSKIPLIKIKMPKKAEEGEEVKSHYCKECDRSFSSGKALGGHMSSAHVQANKDYSLKKLSSKRKASDSGYSTTCNECGRVFQSEKSLFGHMRCHPERDYRGMVPPPEQHSDDFSSDDQIDSGVRQEVGFRLKGWPTSKRGRGPVSINRADDNEKDSFVAGLQLLKKLKQEEERRARPQPEIDLKKPDGDGEIEGSGIKEKENVEVKNQIAETLINDAREDVLMTAIQVLVSGKREREKAGLGKNMMMMEGEKGESASPSKYRCNVCARYFTTHQALGGHRSSHNKFKLNVVNTSTRDAIAALSLSDTRRRKPKPKPNKTPAPSPLFAFDLNESPMEEDSSHHTSSAS